MEYLKTEHHYHILYLPPLSYALKCSQGIQNEEIWHSNFQGWITKGSVLGPKFIYPTTVSPEPLIIENSLYILIVKRNITIVGYFHVSTQLNQKKGLKITKKTVKMLSPSFQESAISQNVCMKRLSFWTKINRNI